MRSAPPSPFAVTDSIIEPISRIASLGDYRVVCDWSFSDHPETLVPSLALVTTAPRLAKIFPNGFFVFSSALSSGILVSINEDEPNLEVSAVEFD